MAKKMKERNKNSHCVYIDKSGKERWFFPTESEQKILEYMLDAHAEDEAMQDLHLEDISEDFPWIDDPNIAEAGFLVSLQGTLEEAIRESKKTLETALEVQRALREREKYINSAGGRW